METRALGLLLGNLRAHRCCYVISSLSFGYRIVFLINLKINEREKDMAVLSLYCFCWGSL